MNCKCLVILICVIAFAGCKKKQAINCPFTPIEWSQQEEKIIEKNSNIKSVDIGFELDTYLKKIGKVGLDTKTKFEFKALSDKISNHSVQYDQEYVNRWNALVEEICGNLELLRDPILSESFKKELEKEILMSSRNFYEEIMKLEQVPVDNEPDESDIQVPKKNEKSTQKITFDEELIEISIQLDTDSRGARSISVNGMEAQISPNSTPSNPRVLVPSLPGKNQKIEIITIEGDTCFIQRVFDKHKKKSLPIRFIPNCLTKLEKQ